MWAARDRRLGPKPKKGYARVLASTKATCGNPCCTPEASGSDVWRPLKAIARWGRRSACYVRPWLLAARTSAQGDRRSSKSNELPRPADAPLHLAHQSQLRLGLAVYEAHRATRSRDPPRGAADTVHVLHHVRRELLLHHQHHSGQIEPARGEARAGEHTPLVLAEARQRRLPLASRQARVKGKARAAGRAELLGDARGARGRVCEDESPPLPPPHQLQQLGRPLCVVSHAHKLGLQRRHRPVSARGAHPDGVWNVSREEGADGVAALARNSRGGKNQLRRGHLRLCLPFPPPRPLSRPREAEHV
mmetsp:Transcript_1073/g.3465  ORF Transcript_1073/g.3465 Transcript_1073/m.3465 type:complete len:305 (+) Transcript_1073:75-989(+)